MYVSGLFCYPVDGCGGMFLATAPVDRFGIRYDRQWVIIEASTGKRVVPEASAEDEIGVKRIADIGIDFKFHFPKLALALRRRPPLTIELSGVSGRVRKICHRELHLEAIDQGCCAAVEVSAFLSVERPGHYRLIRFADVSEPRLAPSGALLVIGQSSFEDSRQQQVIEGPIQRFRPHIVLADSSPYAENKFDAFSIGPAQFKRIDMPDPVLGRYFRLEGPERIIALGDQIEA